MDEMTGVPSGYKAWQMTRVGNMDASVQNFQARTGQFGAAVKSLGGGWMIVHRGSSALASYVVLPDHNGAAQAATHLAQALGARSVEVDEIPDLGQADGFAILAQARDDTQGRDSAVMVDPVEASRRLAIDMTEPDSWILISLRAPTGRERKKHLRWISHRAVGHGGMHHSNNTDALVMSVAAGASSDNNASFLVKQISSAMPSFDVETRTVSDHDNALGVVAAIAGIASAVGAGWAYDNGNITTSITSLVYGVSLLLGAGSLAQAMGWIRSKTSSTRRAISTMHLSVPDKFFGWVKPPVDTMKDGNPVKHPGNYPLASTAFLASPFVFSGLLAPQSGAVTGSTTTASRLSPKELHPRIGPFVGIDDVGEKVHLSAPDMWAGIALLGSPGSGKSVLTRSLFAWALADKLKPSGAVGFPGQRSTLIAFENKGDGANAYDEWGVALGRRPVIVEISDPLSPGIDLFDVPGTLDQRGEFFANAMVYAFAEGSIQDRSFATLKSVFTAALAVTPDFAARVEGLRPNGSPIYYAYVLLAGYGDALGASLAGEIMSEAVRLESMGAPDPDLSTARDALAPLFQDRSESARRSLIESASNKVGQLMSAEGFWSPTRRKRSWSAIVDSHETVIINSGVSRSGSIADDKLSAIMSSLLMFGLRAAIMRTCSGWQEQGRNVTILADELSLLAGSSPEIITWMRNQGRSYGVSCIFATQYPDQLAIAVRAALMSFSTLITFKQDNGTFADQVAQDASADGSTWERSDVITLDRYQTIIRTNVNQRRVAACTVSIPYFEGDRDSFAVEQGYGRLPLVEGQLR